VRVTTYNSPSKKKATTPAKSAKVYKVINSSGVRDSKKDSARPRISERELTRLT
jgi:hypothetical protein